MWTDPCIATIEFQALLDELSPMFYYSLEEVGLSWVAEYLPGQCRISSCAGGEG